MLGVLLKTLRESFVMILLFAAGLLIVERLLTFVLPEIQGQVTNMLGQLPFAQTMLGALLGVDVGAELSAQIFQSILWVHPVVLTLVWGFEVIFCTRYPVGEIDRGTIDVLLGLPVSRRGVFVCESIVWLATGVLLLTAQFIGYRFGAHGIEESTRPRTATVLLVLLNFGCVYIAVGGAAYFVSSLCDRRSVAIAIVFGGLLTSFLINFLAQFWPPAEHIAFLSVLKYYQPAIIISDNQLPVGKALTLLLFGAVSWIAAGEVIARRSVCTT